MAKDLINSILGRFHPLRSNTLVNLKQKKKRRLGAIKFL